MSAVSPDLLQKFDVPGPRYTSYPTADRFVEAFGPAELNHVLQQRAQGGALGSATPLSVYVHIPFCESLCYYCACNKVITRHHERAAEYLDALDAEIALLLAQMKPGHAVSQLHFGGGSPTFLSDAELQRVMQALRRAFATLVDPAERAAFEVDREDVVVSHDTRAGSGLQDQRREAIAHHLELLRVGDQQLRGGRGGDVRLGAGAVGVDRDADRPGDARPR